MDPSERRTRRVLLVSTVLLSLAAVATAWSSYQAARWTAEYRKASGRTNSIRSDAGRAQGLAEAEKQVDLATFTQWLDAHTLRRTELADFYFRRFRKEFRPAVLAWLETRPLTNREAPLSPFVMPQYRLEAAAEVERLDDETKVYSATGQRASQLSTNYVLAVVLFAVSLFFAGLSTKIGTLRHQEILLVVGCVIFCGAFIWVATSPISVSV